MFYRRCIIRSKISITCSKCYIYLPGTTSEFLSMLSLLIVFWNARFAKVRTLFVISYCNFVRLPAESLTSCGKLSVWLRSLLTA